MLLVSSELALTVPERRLPLRAPYGDDALRSKLMSRLVVRVPLGSGVTALKLSQPASSPERSSLKGSVAFRNGEGPCDGSKIDPDRLMAAMVGAVTSTAWVTSELMTVKLLVLIPCAVR